MHFDLPPGVSDGTVYLNGEFVLLSQARIPVLDRGFLFGDGVYEVIPVYARRPFRFDQHLGRLQHSLDGIRLANPYPQARWTQLVDELVARCPHRDQSLYLQVTRGVARRDHAFPPETRPSVFMMTNALATPSPEAVENGVGAVTAEDNRWLRCDIKSTALLGNVLMRQLAVDAGAAETVLFRDGQLTEGAASNVFVVCRGAILTPPKSSLILPGITRDAILELAHKAGLACEERAVTEAEVLNADELWLTSATREVLAISMLDGKPVGGGKPGPVFRRMHRLFSDFKAALEGAPVHR